MPLHRMVRQENWHIADRAAGHLHAEIQRTWAAHQRELNRTTGRSTDAILNIEHDAKGQRTRIQYGNGTTTRYIYDPETFRLVQLRTTKTSPGDSLPTATEQSERRQCAAKPVLQLRPGGQYH